ncbi:TRAF family member-associated NF-kappa-B activator [Pelodytes ibericus]
MEKNIGEQLNKAYEAFRQACMEKDRYKKELTVKTEFYEQQIRDQKQQIVKLNSWIVDLTEQLWAFTGSGCNAPPASPQGESSDDWISETGSNLSYEKLQDQLKTSLMQKMRYKEKLENEQMKMKKVEEEQRKMESILVSRNDEIRLLKILLKEANERRESPDYKAAPEHEMKVNLPQTSVESSVAGPPLEETAREGVERVFCDLQDEFAQICKLTKEQSVRLNRFLRKKENATGNLNVPVQFSLPVQCTEEANEEAQGGQKPKVQQDKPTSIASITPRGLDPEEEISLSVESLSKLSVKFPPSCDESDFLQSAPENEPKPASDQNPFLNKLHKEALLLPTDFRSATDTELLADTVSSLENLKHLNRGSNYGSGGYLNSDDGRGLRFSSPSRKYSSDFCITSLVDGFESEEATGRTIRGPQKPLWKPQNDEKDLDILGCEKWDRKSSDICEFCQAVFPPTSRSDGDFLRHLNSHFNGQSQNIFPDSNK